MSGWTIRARIAVGYAVLLGLLILVAGVSAFAVTSTRDGYNDALDVQIEEAQGALLASKAFSDSNRNFRAFLLTADPAFIGRYEADLRVSRNGLARLREITAGTDRGARWIEVTSAVDRWQAAAERAVDALLAGRRAEALRIFRDDSLPPALEESRIVRGLVADATARAKAAEDDASGQADFALWVGLLSAIVGVAAGVVTASTLARSVAARLQDAIGTLASASTQILAATRQQAAGVLEEETAVQETSATVDEVKQTVQLSTEKAGGVADAVLRTADVSEDGRRAVNDTIRGTQEAKAQMEALADRIHALNEQAETIAEITATVSDLADQSSLLAVNAGIEAAKAGEAGRGFAVVATEVKALASQSKQAAADIRRNLGEIRHATQAAVFATEQGVTASESGEVLAGNAGEAIHSLVEKLDEAAQAAQQILASSRQQMTGMDQVALAMDNIRQTTAQNMAATRQVEQAAQELNALATGLEKLVGGHEFSRNGAEAL